MSLKDSSGRKSSHWPNIEKYIKLFTLPGWKYSQTYESTLIHKQQITVWLKDQITGKKKESRMELGEEVQGKMHEMTCLGWT